MHTHVGLALGQKESPSSLNMRPRQNDTGLNGNWHLKAAVLQFVPHAASACPSNLLNLCS